MWKALTIVKSCSSKGKLLRKPWKFLQPVPVIMAAPPCSGQQKNMRAFLRPNPGYYRQINVESERQEQDSIFSFYQQLIRLRHERPLIAEGSITFLERKNTDIIAYQRELDGEKLVVFCNFRSHEVSLQEESLQEYIEAGFSKLLGNYEGLEKNLRPFEVAALIR